MSGPRNEPENIQAESKADSESATRSGPSGSSQRSYTSRFSFLAGGFRSVLRGEIGVGSAARELLRRSRVLVTRRRERRMLDELASQKVQLRPEFQTLSSGELLKHFRERSAPAFLPGFDQQDSTAERQRQLFPDETRALLEAAGLITRKHRWPLLGFGEKDFGESINWNRDPLSGRLWPLDYHANISLWLSDGSDIRVLWELNRLGHLVALGRAYALTTDEAFAEEFFRQVDGWRDQNPVGRGANWSCAMEAALRAMNLLAAYSLLRKSPGLTEERLLTLLTMLDQHGGHIKRNLEFSNIATSNHYLSDIVGLLWLGIMLPELSSAEEWRGWAMSEMLREMDKQILPDGADYEASTGYHRFVLELFLYSFILCDSNDIPIEEKYWQKLRAMFGYVRGTLRPDGLAPLIGDTDGGQVLPILRRTADDHGYLLTFGAVIFADSGFKLPRLQAPEELLWTLGADGVRNYESLSVSSDPVRSQSFPDAGTYLMRHDDLYLLLNANGAHKGRPTSHRHNDALSIELSACGRAFITDPGSYLYTANLHERHLFRSTAYHSTVGVDGFEQNRAVENLPFALGNDAEIQVLEWNPGPESETLEAEHYGYRRLAQSVTHRRRVVFNKRQRYWLLSDRLTGEGKHDLSFRFHFAPGLETRVRQDGILEVCDRLSGLRLLIHAGELNVPGARPPELETRFSSHNYGEKEPSVSACWFVSSPLPFALHFVMVPICPGEDEGARLSQAMDLED